MLTARILDIFIQVGGIFEPRFDKQEIEIGICDLCILQPRIR